MFLGGFVHHLKSRNTHALKGVRRAARLECAASQKACTDGLYARGGRKHLLPAFDRAWPRHHGHLSAANLHAITKLDDRALRAKCAAGQLVRRTDADHIEHARQYFKFAQIHIGCGPYAGQNGLR